MIGRRAAADLLDAATGRGRGSTARPSMRGSAATTGRARRTCSVPDGISARISVGETPRVVMPCRSTSDQSRSGPGWVGSAVVEEHRRAERERADDLPRPHDPAEVGDPMQDLARAQVHLVGDLLRDLHEEPAVDVQHALRAAGGAARVADEQRVLALQRLGVEAARRRPSAISRATSRARPPAAPSPACRRTIVLPTDRTRARAPRTASIIGTARPFRGNASAVEQHLHAGILQAGRDGVRPEPAEDRHPDRPDLRAGHHRGDGLRRSSAGRSRRRPWTRRRVDGAPGRAGRSLAELRVGPRPRVAVLALPHHRGRASGVAPAQRSTH